MSALDLLASASLSVSSDMVTSPTAISELEASRTTERRTPNADAMVHLEAALINPCEGYRR